MRKVTQIPLNSQTKNTPTNAVWILISNKRYIQSSYKFCGEEVCLLKICPEFIILLLEDGFLRNFVADEDGFVDRFIAFRFFGPC